MKYNRLNSATVCLSVCINAWLGVVLCIGSDGHMSFEPAAHECCDHRAGAERAESSHPSEGQADSRTQGVHDQHCVDIPISLGMPENRIPDCGPERTSPPVGILALLEPGSDATSARMGVFRPPSANTASLLSLRTIVLQV